MPPPDAGRLAPHLRERLLLLAALLHEGPGPLPLGAAPLDWEFLLRCARQSAVLAVLGRVLDGAPGVPASVAARLREAHTQNALQNAVLLHDLAQVSAALSGAGVRHLPLKGAALLAVHGERAAARHMDDIDLLVAEEDVPRAARVLDALGYTRKAMAPLVDFDGTLVTEVPDRPHQHQLPACMSPAGTMLELHRARPGEREDDAPDFEALWARSRRARVHGVGVPVPAEVDLLVGVCAHVFAHHGASPRYLPRHLFDVRLLQSAHADAAAEAGARPPLVRGAIRLSLAAFRAARSRTRAPLVALLVFPPAPLRSVTGLATSAVLFRKYWGEAVVSGRLRMKLLPSRRYMAHAYGVREDSALLPLLHAHRLTTLPLHYLRRWR
jgi:hypothetical protein